MKTRPNVILIVMDTVRADHLSCYGYRRKTTPNIDRIAKQGTLFEKAFSTSPWSPPSHASIFTGKYPSYHRTLGKNVFLSENNRTLAEILSSNGYQTIGFSSCGIVALKNGFNTGFQEFVEMYELPQLCSYRSLNISGEGLKSVVRFPRDAARTLIYGPDHNTYRTNELVKKWIDKNHDDRPFFLFVNYFTCHDFHMPPRPFGNKFIDDFEQSKFYLIELLSNYFGRTTERIYNPELDIQKLQYAATCEGIYSFMGNKLRISKAEWEVIKSWYDGQLSYLDYRIGELINFLDRKKIYNDTCLIMTADHGENFGEHNLAGHLFCLYDSLVHVPFIIRYPDMIPNNRRTPILVSSIDILPTVLGVVGINNKYKNVMQGKNLYPLDHRERHKFICAEFGKSITEVDVIKNTPKSSGLKRLDKGFKCIRTKSYKYILSSDGKEELYDLCDDPSEEIDISQRFPNEVKHLRKQLGKTLDISCFGSEEYLTKKESEEILKRLKALGYID